MIKNELQISMNEKIFDWSFINDLMTVNWQLHTE